MNNLFQINNKKSDKKSDSILSDSSNSINNKKYKKMYWQYGNRGIKIEDFDKKMCKNLAIMYYTDLLFNDFLNNIKDNSLSKLFKSETPISYKFKNGYIKNIDGKIYVTLEKNKINNSYEVLNVGHTVILNINTTEETLFSKRIPNLSSIMKSIGNIVHLSKITRIFRYSDSQFIIRNNTVDTKFNFNNFSKNGENIITELLTIDKKNITI